MDPKYLKGYYRRASSHLALGKFKLALKDYELVRELDDILRVKLIKTKFNLNVNLGSQTRSK